MEPIGGHVYDAETDLHTFQRTSQPFWLKKLRVTVQSGVITSYGSVQTHRASADDIAAIDIRGEPNGDADTGYVPYVWRKDGTFFRLKGLSCGPTHRWFKEVPPRPEMVALVEEIRRLLGMEGPVEVDPLTLSNRRKVINRANKRALKEQGDHPASEMP